MSKIKIVKDNVLLSIEEEELAQYEARGYSKLGATKKVASKDLEKELKKITKVNEELTAKIEELKKNAAIAILTQSGLSYEELKQKLGVNEAAATAEDTEAEQ